MTPAEIVKALRCCATVDGSGCCECPAIDGSLKSELDCDVLMKTEAADLIERLEKEKAALLERVKIFEGCDTCANYNPMCCAEECGACGKRCPCASCTFGSNWEWKGLEDEK